MIRAATIYFQYYVVVRAAVAAQRRPKAALIIGFDFHVLEFSSRVKLRYLPHMNITSYEIPLHMNITSYANQRKFHIE